PAKVITVVHRRVTDRLCDIRVCGEMHDRRHPIGAKSCGQSFSIRQIALNEWSPAHRFAMAARQIVEDHRPVSGARQDLTSVTADVSRSTRHQNRLKTAHSRQNPWENAAIISGLY